MSIQERVVPSYKVTTRDLSDEGFVGVISQNVRRMSAREFAGEISRTLKGFKRLGGEILSCDVDEYPVELKQEEGWRYNLSGLDIGTLMPHAVILAEIPEDAQPEFTDEEAQAMATNHTVLRET